MSELAGIAPVEVPGGDITSLLLKAIEIGASDTHLTVGNPPMYRLHGSIIPTALPQLSRERLHVMLYDVLDDDQRKKFERDKELDFALEFGKTARFRANCFFNMKGEGAVFRVIPTKIKTLEELRMPEVLKRIAEKRRGLALVTGPTGSGKSTTLAAMIDYINSTRHEHILTIEDPIEFVHPNKTCIINQREVGANTQSFAAALRSALREDPDVILVGEMRDLETISLALTAAETGHLVFGTLHTQSAPKTCDRLIDVFPPEQQGLVRLMFAESFQAIVCQTLVPKKDGRGRVCAMEILLGTSATRSLIREGKTHQLYSIVQTSQKMGMQSMDQHLKALLEQGLISEKDALMKANSPDYIVPNGMAKLDELIARGSPAAQKRGTNPGLMAMTPGGAPGGPTPQPPMQQPPQAQPMGANPQAVRPNTGFPSGQPLSVKELPPRTVPTQPAGPPSAPPTALPIGGPPRPVQPGPPNPVPMRPPGMPQATPGATPQAGTGGGIPPRPPNAFPMGPRPAAPPPQQSGNAPGEDTIRT